MSIFTLYYIIPFLATMTAIFIVVAIHYTFFSETKQTLYSESPQLPDQLAGRDKEIRRLAGQILTGQSSAIMSAFEEDRTALLGYLSDPSNSKKLYGEAAENLIFSLLDISTLPKEYTPPQFWERVLKPLEEKNEQIPSLAQIYQTCKENQFNEYYLDRLVVQLKQEGWRLVLMLDRFDDLLNSNLYQPTFFATLRQLASSRSPSSLSLIISANISLKQFHEKTKHINPKGSPYLNFMENGEIVLGALSDSEVEELLREMSFSKLECQFITEIAGRHPHFIQKAASALQTAKEIQVEQPLEIAKQDFYDRVENMLTNIIHSWDLEVCQAMLSFVKENKAPDFFNGELSLLEKQGFLIRDSQNQWQVSPRVLVDFIKRKTEQERCNH